MDETTEPQPPFPEATALGGAPLPPLSEADRSIARLLLAMVVTVASTLIAAETGGLLAAFGLGAGALALALVALLVGLLFARRMMLPLGIVAAALTLPAAVVSLSEHRLDPSAGLLTVTPTHSTEIDSRTYRRGLGSVFLDLRQMTPTPGATITVTARADAGRVVVALPRNRCYNLRVRSRRLPTPSAASRVALGLVGAPTAPTDDGSDLISQGTFSLPPDKTAVPRTGSLIAFGRSVNASMWTRSATDLDAPTLVLDVAGAAPTTVRDYPDNVGPLNAFSGDQVGSRQWPAEIMLPPSPGDVNEQDQWHRNWTEDQIARAVPRKWATWERETIAAAKALAGLAAGPCASTAVLGSTWATAGYQAEQSARYISVNGAGAVQRFAFGSDGVMHSDSATVTGLQERASARTRANP